jgi:hypothetical protein
MVRVQRRLHKALPLVLVPALAAATFAHAQHFHTDDPIQRVPEVVPVNAKLPVQGINALYDFALNSARYKVPPPTPSLAINTLGQVPDSSWFTDRHALHPLTREELKRGPRSHGLPQPPFSVVAAKTEGVTPGFQIKDARGLRYFIKVDPATNPEMATAADVIAPLFLYAAGYNVPENYILTSPRSQFHLSDKATITAGSGKKHRMTPGQLEDILDRVPTTSDGRIRVLASLGLDGKIIGPFRYAGTRSDDPNDVIPHQQRRDLRGLAVLFAWINHTDAKGDNSMDTVVGEGDQARVLHHLLDFGDSFGSDSDIEKDPRHGQEFFLPTSHEQVHRAYTLGLRPAAWETVHYPHDLPAVGNFTADAFDPLTWKPNYPNPAFSAMLPGDAYWGATKVIAFSNDDIHAIVEEGQFSNPAATDLITRILIQRRDAIARAWFTRVLPLEDLRIEDDHVAFTDLAAKYGVFPSTPALQYSWFRFDNTTSRATETSGSSATIPSGLTSAADGDFIGCTILRPSGPSLTAYFHRESNSWKLVGVTRKPA